jgi:hypothetical protein
VNEDRRSGRQKRNIEQEPVSRRKMENKSLEGRSGMENKSLEGRREMENKRLSDN